MFIISLIISRNQDYVREDTDITRSIMDLWVVSVISNPDIKADFYAWTKTKDEVVFLPPEQPKNNKQAKKPPSPIVIMNAADLVISGLFSGKGQTIRKKFQESLEMVSERVHDGSKSERPLFWLLSILIDKSPVWDGSEDTKTQYRDS